MRRSEDLRWSNHRIFFSDFHHSPYRSAEVARPRRRFRTILWTEQVPNTHVLYGRLTETLILPPEPDPEIAGGSGHGKEIGDLFRHS